MLFYLIRILHIDTKIHKNNAQKKQKARQHLTCHVVFVIVKQNIETTRHKFIDILEHHLANCCS